ncbi:arsenate reductase family protein [Paenibacillus chitinolyticus]|uniref:arsenate reductase family protein n=1 Tax=Paenibacillus chitinolyticus TaxID=79263 RepID=UPI002DBEB706|nr:arsenate reductase family protein [Paenibacillus chitinolyticus]MEC0246749.1 arsenate reductase family protein [Paenibacillus chitinolyticus]
MSVTIYEYSKCSTCRSALKWLRAKGLDPVPVPILEQPPTAEEIRVLVRNSGLELKKFFNTGGEVYRELGLKDKLGSMTEDEQLALLASNGKLLKRPIVTDGGRVTVGFKEADFEKAWG